MVVWDVEFVCFDAPESAFVLHRRWGSTLGRSQRDILFAIHVSKRPSEALFVSSQTGILVWLVAIFSSPPSTLSSVSGLSRDMFFF